MTRRGFFRLAVGAAAWVATQHVAWAFPEPVHAIPQRYLYARIQLTGPLIATTGEGAFVRAMNDEIGAMVRDIKEGFDRSIYARRLI